jgi:hypothetical protein
MDPSGAVVPGCAVVVVLQEKNLTWRTTTNEAGRYVFPSLPLGTYLMRVTAQGFKTTKVSGNKLRSIIDSGSIA